MENIITITDGFTLNPGDLDWEKFESLGKLNYFDRSAEDDVRERCKDSTVIVTNKTPISASTIAMASRLRVIAVSATGYNIVDIEAASSKGVIVCNVPGYGTDSVAQHTFALILELTNHVGQNARSVYEGEWFKSQDFCYTKAPIVELSGKTLGIVGYGMIGRKVGEIAQALGMRVIYSRSSPDSAASSIDEVFAKSDIVSLHCPLTKDNKEFVNASLLSKMKRNALLINTARGQLINENDLAHALQTNQIRGAALDVLSKEPPSKDNPLIPLKNCLITPHNAWYSFEARKRIMDTTYENIKHALQGAPQNVVNP